MRHLVRMASYSSQTNMHARNLAIVWAPNLLRSKDIESTGFNGTAAFMEVRVQSIVVEFILTHVEQLFGDWKNCGKENEGGTSAPMNWPTCVPEDYYRSLSYNLPNMLNHGDGPPQIRPYHTIIEFSDHKRKGSLKGKKWKSIFNLGKTNQESKRKSQKHDDKDGKSMKMSLRPAKSMDSLSSVTQASHDSDLEHNGLVLRSPRNQLSLRRESLGSPSKEEHGEFIFTDPEEQPRSLDTNDAEYEEEEHQAKSEPTTPKPARSSIIGNPPGRSPKSNQSRAEKCVGVHISGPFSVTLPFHITSNLSRLTRGMECPGLSILPTHKGSDKLFSIEGNLSAESDDTDKVTANQVVDKESDNHSNAGIEGTIAEDPGTDNVRISLEVQDTFSFLDIQDTSSEKIPENTVDSEMLEFGLHAENKMEEFSVEPPPDYPCNEDEAEQMYFMPTGFVDEVGHWREMQESLEDIYLSAHDDLSPIRRALEKTLENQDPSSEEQLDILQENLPTDTVMSEGTLEENHLRIYGVSNVQEGPQSLTSSEIPCNEIYDTEVDGQQCSTDDGGTKVYVASREKAEHIEPYVPHNDLQKNATIVDPDPGEAAEHIRPIDTDNDLQKDSTIVDPDPGEAAEHIRPSDPDNDLQKNSTIVDPDPGEAAEHIRPSDPDNDLQKDSTIVDPDPGEAAEHIEPSDTYNDLQEETSIVDPGHGEAAEHIGPSDPYNDLQKDATIVDLKTREEQNMGLPNAENRSAMTASEETPREEVNQEDEFETVKCKESGDGSVSPVREPSGEQVDCTVEKHHRCHRQDEETSQQPMTHVQHLHILLSGATLENDNCKEEEDSNVQIADPHDVGDKSENCLSRRENVTGPIPPSGWQQKNFTKGQPAEDLECSSNEEPDSCLCLPAEEPTGDDQLCDQINTRILEEKSKDSLQEEAHQMDLNEGKEAYVTELRPAQVSQTPVELDIIVPGRTHLGGSVGMKLMSTTNKIQQAKSVPVVPPKPQFAKLPPSLKNKLHGSCSLSASKDIKPPKSESSSQMETTETSTDGAPKRRTSWKNATSISFDTAMALAKERQSQTPVRRMQTYCIGDFYDVLDTPKADITAHAPRFTVQSASNRTHRPFSCMSLSCGDRELHGPNVLQKDSLHGLQSTIGHESDAYSKEVPNRNRLSMPRLGQPSMGHDQSKCHQQRRSLL
ncbi:uncharacterized protein RB166_021376 [Leptodactylus fuscus]